MEPFFQSATAIGSMFWVYILQNPKGRFYIGQTDNLQARLFSHNRTDKVIGNSPARMALGSWLGAKNMPLGSRRWRVSVKSIV